MICVVGLGFVGLTTALGFAEKGHSVVGMDRSAQLVAALSQGSVPFSEPGLEPALKRHLQKSFRVTSDLDAALSEADSVFICVGTNSDERGGADVRAVTESCRQIAQRLRALGRNDGLIIVKSTVPPGTTLKLCRELQMSVAASPEFLRESSALQDFLAPDRIVIGAEDPATHERVAKLYEPFGDVPIVAVSTSTAEYTKYLSNALLATLISFSNEMALLGKNMEGIDLVAAFKALHADHRWRGQPAAMTSYVFPGAGFGGSCLPKDARALVELSRSLGGSTPLLQAVLETNQRIKAAAVAAIAAEADESKPLGILGLSFKPGSSDVRETPSYDLIAGLIAAGFEQIWAYDPAASDAFQQSFALPIHIAPSLEALIAECSTLVISTAWPEFKQRAALFADKRVFDLRHLLETQINPRR